MAITRQKKEEILKNLRENIKQANIVVFVNFHGLSVLKAMELRKMLRQIGAGYVVAKKTIIKKAFEKSGFSGELPELEGEIALVFSKEDPVASAKTIEQFAQKNKTIKIMGGMFESSFVGPDKIVVLANIPPREVLLSQFVNVINSPIQGVVSVLDGVIRNFAVVLNQIAKSRS